MKNIDLHIHSKFSDGNSTIKSIIETAHAKNIAHLAITDHYTTSWKKYIIKTISLKNFQKYIAEIKRERELAQVNCLVGIEIDMGSNLSDVKRIPFGDFEILLFEYVDSLVTLKDVISLKNEFEIKAITALAHNGYIKLANMETFSNLLVENDIFFELNSRYLRTSDTGIIQKIKIMKDYNVTFTLGSDAHKKNRIGDVAESLLILEAIDGFENLINLNQKRNSPN